jgi:hypothetical protein
MPKRIVKQPVQIVREGKTIAPRVGEEFDFTDAEVKAINGVQPKALAHIIVPEKAEAAKAAPKD